MNASILPMATVLFVRARARSICVRVHACVFKGAHQHHRELFVAAVAAVAAAVAIYKYSQSAPGLADTAATALRHCTLQWSSSRRRQCRCRRCRHNVIIHERFSSPPWRKTARACMQRRRHLIITSYIQRLYCVCMFVFMT